MTTQTPWSPDDVVARLITDTSPYLSCDECFDRLDRYVEARLADPRHSDIPMQTHLRGCPACREEEAALRELVALDAALG